MTETRQDLTALRERAKEGEQVTYALRMQHFCVFNCMLKLYHTAQMFFTHNNKYVKFKTFFVLFL